MALANATDRVPANNTAMLFETAAASSPSFINDTISPLTNGNGTRQHPLPPPAVQTFDSFSVTFFEWTCLLLSIVGLFANGFVPASSAISMDVLFACSTAWISILPHNQLANCVMDGRSHKA